MWSDLGTTRCLINKIWQYYSRNFATYLMSLWFSTSDAIITMYCREIGNRVNSEQSLVSSWNGGGILWCMWGRVTRLTSSKIAEFCRCVTLSVCRSDPGIVFFFFLECLLKIVKANKWINKNKEMKIKWKIENEEIIMRKINMDFKKCHEKNKI